MRAFGDLPRHPGFLGFIVSVPVAGGNTGTLRWRGGDVVAARASARKPLTGALPTATFAIFFAIVLPLNWLFAPKPKQWRIFIIIASYVFYGWWSAPFVLLLASVSVWTQ